ncbi:hypothetical protein NEOLI_001976 [Neolecta irregularis DAH-3]|uniref:Uncharacterized protein n=1 Tax=Neolecta irregularis (strain DAH-3) TaxID=1198029 RepID=A0A1U7LWP7_NEOID|nr:hypothetical protein NEOLI_001976 [Neolecta irregularis DAH-3]|eukprot:OLL26972.1 hypothetical protein NEOLI_001976 [Neolecta irregularis DAH-3]
MADPQSTQITAQLLVLAAKPPAAKKLAAKTPAAKGLGVQQQQQPAAAPLAPSAMPPEPASPLRDACPPADRQKIFTQIPGLFPQPCQPSAEDQVMAELSIRAKSAYNPFPRVLTLVDKIPIFTSFASQTSTFDFSHPDRFGKLHSNTFSSMDSITTHYAAKRKCNRGEINTPAPLQKRQQTEELPQHSAKRIRLHRPPTSPHKPPRALPEINSRTTREPSDLEPVHEAKAVYQPIIDAQTRESNKRKLQLSKQKRAKEAKRTPRKIRPLVRQPAPSPPGRPPSANTTSTTIKRPWK